MGKITGFLEFGRNSQKKRSIKERTEDWKEIYLNWNDNESGNQAARCMDCGVPFCNNGCPLGNLIPEWNDAVYRGDWKNAIQMLHATNNFPEFTGRICPAPCEASCILSINQDPVTIELIEKTITEKAFSKGFIKPKPPSIRTGKKIAIIGSGPAGLATAQQLNRAGHTITVFEKNEYIGGLLSLGIPDFKLEKWVVDRRTKILEQEGILFKPSTDVGKNYPTSELNNNFDAICLAGGSTIPRDLEIYGRELKGIYQAMPYLTQQNRINKGISYPTEEIITARGKNVIILGGGDTGADCLGTAHRQKAKSIKQFELMPLPPNKRNIDNPWPKWPLILHTSPAHEEGGERDYSILTKKFSGTGNQLKTLHAVRIKWFKDKKGKNLFEEIPNSDFKIEAELVLLALGFLHPQHDGLLKDLEVEFDEWGNVKTNSSMMSNKSGVFACGDMEQGQSLVVTAIASGRDCARFIDEWLMGKSNLPRVRGYAKPIPFNK